MLIIRRKTGEAILIGEEVEVEVIEISGNRVKLGLHAPARVPILRKEIQSVAEQNRAAMRNVTPTAVRVLAEGLRRSIAQPPPAIIRTAESD